MLGSPSGPVCSQGSNQGKPQTLCRRDKLSPLFHHPPEAPRDHKRQLWLSGGVTHAEWLHKYSLLCCWHLVKVKCESFLSGCSQLVSFIPKLVSAVLSELCLALNSCLPFLVSAQIATLKSQGGHKIECVCICVCIYIYMYIYIYISSSVWRKSLT